MPRFDVVLGMVPNYVHGCLLGVTKSLLYQWFSATNHKKPYFIGGQVLQWINLLQFGILQLFLCFGEKSSCQQQSSFPFQEENYSTIVVNDKHNILVIDNSLSLVSEQVISY